MTDAANEAAAHPPPPASVAERLQAWESLIRRAVVLLATPPEDAAGLGQLRMLAAEVRQAATLQPDTGLYLLIHEAGGETRRYSTLHALACTVVGTLAAASLDWPAEEAEALACAALTMNISMSAEHDALAQQSGQPSAAQRAMIEGHADLSAQCLADAGLDDGLWRQAVRDHHRPPHGDSEMGPGAGRVIELLRRIDIYTAKLSRRLRREPMPASLAARDACLSPAGQPDALGATLLRVIGLYPPGTWVQLANGETGLVVRRGAKAYTPLVASLRRADGGLLVPPTARDSARAAFAVRLGLRRPDGRLTVVHERVLACAG